MALQHLVETCPTEHVLTVTPREPFPPYLGNFVSEPTQLSTVAADAIVGEVAPHQHRQMAMLIADRPVPAVPTPVVHCGHSAGKAALGRDLPDHTLAIPRPSPDMGEAEKVKGGSSRPRMPRAFCLLRAEVDEACLVGMKRQPIPRKTLVQYCQDAFGIDTAVERHDRIVSESDKGACSFEARPHLAFEPFIQHMVQEDVRETGEITPPCGEPSVVRCRRPLSTAPAFNHLSIILRMTPSVTLWSRNVRSWEWGIVVEVLAYVDLDHPVKTLGPNVVPQLAQGVVRRAAWPEAV